MWSFNNDKPIYIQLIEQIINKIIISEYKTGDKLPSVRDLASVTKVNPNTVQKALQEIENYGLISTQRTNGKFITEDISIINEFKENYINNKLDQFLNDMKQLNVSYQEIIKKIKMKGYLNE